MPSNSSGGKWDHLTADAGAWLGAGALSARDCAIGLRRVRRRNWRFAVVGAGIEEVEPLGLLDSAELGVLGELLNAVELVDVSCDGWCA